MIKKIEPISAIMYTKYRPLKTFVKKKTKEQEIELSKKLLDILV